MHDDVTVICHMLMVTMLYRRTQVYGRSILRRSFWNNIFSTLRSSQKNNMRRCVGPLALVSFVCIWQCGHYTFTYTILYTEIGFYFSRWWLELTIRRKLRSAHTHTMGHFVPKIKCPNKTIVNYQRMRCDAVSDCSLWWATTETAAGRQQWSSSARDARNDIISIIVHRSLWFFLGTIFS